MNYDVQIGSTIRRGVSYAQLLLCIEHGIIYLQNSFLNSSLNCFWYHNLITNN